jgi:RimJ/RimL family protein N-acetyltransferase
LESTNPSILRPLAAQSVALGLASVAPLAARIGLAPTSTPTLPREFQLGQPSQPASLLAPRGQYAQIPAIRFPVIKSLRRRKPPMRLDLATPADLEAILGLIEEASRWLKARGKDQWAAPWPDREQRDARVLKGLANRKTVIVRQGDTAVATVTMANWHNPNVWVNGSCTADLTERAVYLHRLITARKYAGQGLGESLINWAEKRSRAQYGAQRTRIDVWTTNVDLHRYYQRLGFESCGQCPDRSYPSGALFERPIVPGRSMPLPQ